MLSEIIMQRINERMNNINNDPGQGTFYRRNKMKHRDEHQLEQQPM